MKQGILAISNITGVYKTGLLLWFNFTLVFYYIVALLK